MPETRTSATENSSTPLLTRQSGHYSLFGGRVRSSTAISILLGLILGRHGASMAVRESTAHQLEVSRDNWGYSLPVVVINTIWNLAFVVVSIVMLLLTAREKPDVPIRAWICVYALQRVVHVVLVWFEYGRRMNLRAETAESSSSSDTDSIFGHSKNSDESTPKVLEYYNTIIQYLWLLVAFLLLSNFDMQSAPRLYWLTLTFVAMDVFFAVIGCLRSLLITFAICCCLQSVIAFLFFMSGVSGEGGASEEEIKVLPMYKYQVSNDEQQPEVGGKMVPFETNDPEYSSERAVLLEDADCCICLCAYEEGTELHLLPCNHPFHVPCILKWLMICRTCPLCKCLIPQAIKV